MRRMAAMMATLALILWGCAGQTEKTSRSGFALDTAVSITIYDQSVKTADAVLDRCFDELERLEALLSATREGSDVDRINRADGQPVTVAEETAELLELSCRVSEWSDGVFDVTIRPVSALWDFSADDPRLPDAAALAAACEQVDYRNLTVSGTTVTLAEGGIEPGGVAKGYIADRLREVLEQAGVASALIDLGGNIVACGDKQGEAFRIGIKDPADTSSLAAVIRGRDCSVVTSGTYERGFTLNGVRYHHLLDPDTGMPVQNGLASVTVITQSSALADALSTACFVMGETRARAMLDELDGVEVLFIYEDGTLSVTDGLHLIDTESAVPEYTCI